MSRMARAAASLAATAFFAGAAPAPSRAEEPPKVFHVATRGVRDVNVAFESRAPLETIIGATNKASGRVTFNPEARGGSVELHVDAASLRTGIALRDEHLRGPQWLDAEQFPEMVFRSAEVVAVEGEENEYLARGELTIRGVSRQVEATVRAEVFPRSPETEEAGFGQGDAAHFKTRFEIKLSDYGVKIPPAVALKVSNSVTIGVDVFASTDPGPLARAAEEERENGP